MNKVILMGRLARDPDLRYSTSGQSVCRYTLAVNRSYKREGDPDADFINIVSFGPRGEFAGKYFRKGMMVAICGELRVSSYEQNGVKRYSTDVVATDQYTLHRVITMRLRETDSRLSPMSRRLSSRCSLPGRKDLRR